MSQQQNNDFKKAVNTFFEEPKLLINKNIYKFLFKLLYYIFIESDNEKNLLAEIKKNLETINRDWIKNNNNYINEEYSEKNLINIVKFVKTQNSLYAGEIIENILIMIFSFAFKTEKNNTFGKFLYNNIAQLKDPKDESLINWINKNKLKGELSEIRKLLKNDLIFEELQMCSKMQEKPIFKFLLEIYYEKYVRKKLERENIMNYLNRRIFDIENKNKQRDNAKNDRSQTEVDSQISITAFSLISNYFTSGGQIGQTKKTPIPLLKSLFISIYIYYQNKNSPLMKYIKEEENLAKISFEYNLLEAVIETRFAGIVLSPLRIEPRVEEMNLGKNTFRENGFLELAKIFLFNSKSIKKIDCHTNMLKTFYLDFLNMRLGLFDNYSVEEINISYNLLKNDCGEYLANILSHLKNLKTINLASNDLKNGIGPFIITLKNLYRQGKTKLESLNLNNCLLDDIAYYEIGELLKSKYCKLKKLYLNNNNIPSTVNFIKKLKKNRSLTQIYFNTSNISNNNTDDIMRIISNTNIEYLYLFKNRINDFSNLLRIIYRTKLIKIEENNIYEIGHPYLYNLDLSFNTCYNKNIDKIKLLKKIIEITTLNCLDISRVLYGGDPNKILNKNKQNDPNDPNHQPFKTDDPKYSPKKEGYINEINTLVYDLKRKQKNYIKNISDMNRNEIDIRKFKGIENEQIFKNLDKDIDNILENDNANFTIFIKKEAKRLIDKNDNIKEYINKSNNRKEEEGKIYQNLVKYIIMKRAEKNIKELKKNIKDKKLIII